MTLAAPAALPNPIGGRQNPAKRVSLKVERALQEELRYAPHHLFLRRRYWDDSHQSD